MQRWLALCLASVISFLLIGPAWAVNNTANTLPPCCRKSGIHHCALRNGHNAQQGPAVTMHCPYSVKTVSAAVTLAYGLPQPANTTADAVISQLVAEAQAGYRYSLIRTRHKRGPPTLLL